MHFLQIIIFSLIKLILHWSMDVSQIYLFEWPNLTQTNFCLMREEKKSKGYLMKKAVLFMINFPLLTF